MLDVMQQWYKCSQCSQDVLYGTNPCPYCGCSLAWSQQGPILYRAPVGAFQQQAGQPPLAEWQRQVVQPIASIQSTKKTAKSLVISLATVGGGLLLLFGIYTIYANLSTPKSSALSNPTSRELILSLSGSGDDFSGSATTTTKAFHINKNEWYIETTCDALKSTNPVVLIASVFPKDKPVDNYSFVAIASQNTPGSAVNYIHEAGDFYLSVVAMNVKSWSVRVYQ
jgi:hypothetical protein